jgi:hypothetical protein
MLSKHLEDSDEWAERQEAAIDHLMGMVERQTTVLMNLPTMLLSALRDRLRGSLR